MDLFLLDPLCHIFECFDHISYDLVNSFKNGICLGVSSCYAFLLYPIFFYYHFGKFSHLSKIIFLGHGYLLSQHCSTALTTVMASLFGICFISNQEVAGSIIVTHQMVEYFFFISLDFPYFFMGIL